MKRRSIPFASFEHQYRSTWSDVQRRRGDTMYYGTGTEVLAVRGERVEILGDLTPAEYRDFFAAVTSMEAMLHFILGVPPR